LIRKYESVCREWHIIKGHKINLQLLGDPPALPDIIREKVAGKADPGGVGQLDCLVLSLKLVQRDDRTEDLFLKWTKTVKSYS